MENRAEEPEALSAISPADHVIKLVDPFMRKVDGVVERLEPMRGHCGLHAYDLCLWARRHGPSLMKIKMSLAASFRPAVSILGPAW